jgi:hypothetical protein
LPRKKSPKNNARKPPPKPRRPSATKTTGEKTAQPKQLPELIATTIGEAATLLGISPRVFAHWATEPGFPGQPGEPGKRNGNFPIDSIRTWHLATHAPSWRSRGSEDDEAAAARRLKLLIECDQAQVELERELGTIGDTETWAAFCRRVVAATKAQLEEVADRTLARLPGKIDAATRKIIRKAIEQTVADALNTIAELIAGDDDEAEDLADDEE